VKEDIIIVPGSSEEYPLSLEDVIRLRQPGQTLDQVQEGRFCSCAQCFSVGQHTRATRFSRTSNGLICRACLGGPRPNAVGRRLAESITAFRAS
jgi:hypothetical protein